MATAGGRALPTFLVIGTQRGGTSAFFAGLRSHPDVSSASVKEVHYYDLNHGRGERWYRSFFPRRSAAQAHVGEATPNYLFHPLAPGWVAESLPTVKVVALLRDPVERAHSAWKLMGRLGFEDLTFEDALDAEEERIAPDLARLDRDPDYPPHALMRHSYVARGRYAEQLSRWAVAIPAEHTLVLASEDFYADPPAVLGEAARFLGLAPYPFPDGGAVNAAPPGSRSMRPETRERLLAEFEPHTAALEERLGRRFAWERPAG
jgi:hypothetical protein